MIESLIIDEYKISKILITGSAGFIGFSISQKLLLENITVLGVDTILL